MPCSVNDLDKIRLNTHYSDYEPIIETCRIVLNQLFYNSEGYEQSHWCLLLPMEMVFEDFITGFIQENFKEWNVTPQKSDLKLTELPKAFDMYHDIHIEKNSVSIIIDTKYKTRTAQDYSTAKKGVAQSDMYQMLAYAYRRGCKKVIMLYPNIGEKLRCDSFIIKAGFSNFDEDIRITVADIPIWSMSRYSKKELDANLYAALDNILHA